MRGAIRVSDSVRWTIEYMEVNKMYRVIRWIHNVEDRIYLTVLLEDAMWLTELELRNNDEI